MALFDGSVAVVTGSTRGIGLQVALELAGQGASVVVNGRDPSILDGALRQVKDAARGGGASGVAGSAADAGVASSLLNAARALGTPNILINCAGIAEPPHSSILTMDRGAWDQQIDGHLTSTFATCSVFARAMVESGGGSIVNTSSHAFNGTYGGAGYPAAKGGVNSLTYAMAAELAEFGVRVNAVCPGAKTRLSTGPGYAEGIEGLVRRGLLPEAFRESSLNPPPPSYVARLYAFLVSPHASAITGEIFSGAGNYLGRFPRPVEEFIAWRDHVNEPPWTVDEIAAAVSAHRTEAAHETLRGTL